MSDKLQKNGPEESMYQGEMLEVVHQPMRAGEKEITFEIARRAPGVRLIIIRDGKMLLTREFRPELDDYDYRLPGGKVFDRLEEYNKHLGTDLLPFAEKTAKAECREEAGLIANTMEHFTTTHAGSTVTWDLFYFLVTDFEEHSDGQQLEAGEVIDVEWKTYEEVKNLIKTGHMREDRTIGVLFKFFLENSVI